MIVQLSYSNNLLTSSSSKGEVDSTYVSINDLRIANAKMTELKYVKEELRLKDELIHLDSIEIKTLNDRLTSVNNENKLVKSQRNVLVIIAGVFLGIILGITL